MREIIFGLFCFLISFPLKFARGKCVFCISGTILFNLREHEKPRMRSLVLFESFARQKYYCILSHSLFKSS